MGVGSGEIQGDHFSESQEDQQLHMLVEGRDSLEKTRFPIIRLKTALQPSIELSTKVMCKLPTNKGNLETPAKKASILVVQSDSLA